MRKIVEKINEIEPLFEKRTDEQLQHKTVEFKERIAKSETLDDIGGSVCDCERGV